METYEEQIAYRDYPPKQYYDVSRYPDNVTNTYCMYFLTWAGERMSNIEFSCGRYIKNISRTTKQFKKLDTGTSVCKCGRYATQGELA